MEEKIRQHRNNPDFFKPLSESIKVEQHGLITIKYLGKFPALR